MLARLQAVLTAVAVFAVALLSLPVPPALWGAADFGPGRPPTEEERRLLFQQGYAVLRGALPLDVARALREATDALSGSRWWDPRSFWAAAAVRASSEARAAARRSGGQPRGKAASIYPSVHTTIMSAVAAAWTRFDAGDLSAWDPAKRYEAFWYDLWLDEPRVRSAVEATLAPLAAPLLPDRPRALTDRLYVAGEGRPGFNHFHRDFSSNTGAMVQLWMPLEDGVGEAGGSLELLSQSAALALDAAAGGPCAGRLGAQARDLPRGSSCEREAAAAGVLAEMRLGDVLAKLPGVWHRAAALGQMRRRVAYTVSFVPEREAEDR